MVFLNLSIWIIWEEAANCSYQTTLREKPKWRRKSTRLCRSIKTYISCFSGVFCWWLKTLWQLIFIISETEIFSKWADVWLLEGWVHRTDSPTTVIKAWEYALHSLDSSFIMHEEPSTCTTNICASRDVFMHHFPPQKKRLLHCFQELLLVWDSVLSNDGAQDASPMKVGGQSVPCRCLALRSAVRAAMFSEASISIKHKGGNSADWWEKKAINRGCI